jgi:3-phenylpropionate/cinnamic acid dioxygenase small subunit
MNALETRLAIQDVMTRYAAGVDDRDMDLYRACFADDVLIVGFGSEPLIGADEWVKDVSSKLEAFGATQHMLGPQLVTVDGDDASTRTDVQAMHYLKEKPDSMLTLWATYLTDYRCVAGEWKIVRRGTHVTNA